MDWDVTNWNYRVLRRDDGSLTLHEVFYDQDGNPTGCTKDPISFVAFDEEGTQGIIDALEMALADVKRFPVMDYSYFEKIAQTAIQDGRDEMSVSD